MTGAITLEIFVPLAVFVATLLALYRRGEMEVYAIHFNRRNRPLEFAIVALLLAAGAAGVVWGLLVHLS